ISSSSNIYYLNASNHVTYRAFNPCLSADGRFLAFKTEFAPGPGPDIAILYHHDLQTGITSMISSNVSNGTFPEMTSDGRFVAYEATTNVYVWDSNTGSNVLVNVDANGTAPASGISLRPVLTPDGSKVAFL